MASDDIDPLEARARGVAVLLLEEHWRTISKGLVDRYGEDRGQEAFTRLLARIGAGGSIVPFVRNEPDRSHAGLLYTHAERMVGEILKNEGKLRPPLLSLDELMEGVEPEVGEVWQEGPRKGTRRWRDQQATDELVGGLAPTVENVDRIVDAIWDLLDCGERTWSTLCQDGVLNPADWTPHKKWTAIGMMWGFRTAYIAIIRYAMVEPDPNLLIPPFHSTAVMESSVRRNGATLLSAKSRAFRIEHDLPIGEEEVKQP